MEDNQKVLLMGKGNSGKTSMRSIIFANYMPKDTMGLGATIDIEHSSINLMGNLRLDIWDCGGQESFFESYFQEGKREQVFSGVKLLIFVVDVSDTKDDFSTFNAVLEELSQRSPSARVYALIHKMDTIPEGKRSKIFNKKKKQVTDASMFETFCYATSIWDETLYRAWSSIVCSLVPNVDKINALLQNFNTVTEAAEVVLFERNTFLVISHVSLVKHEDEHRFEKISNIIKQFKLSCSKQPAEFNNMEIRNSQFVSFINQFTPSTYIMVIMNDTSIQSAATQINIDAAKSLFSSYV
eukprot:gb/GECH01013918.1/.p1 GENE.gb/GECH01013918.1/~~gb/GECH01013918.1/.p1  ORF type:complete len:297 (+),score=73.95 gb/GECH01013918.1/:1-891(+)